MCLIYGVRQTAAKPDWPNAQLWNQCQVAAQKAVVQSKSLLRLQCWHKSHYPFFSLSLYPSLSFSLTLPLSFPSLPFSVVFGQAENFCFHSVLSYPFVYEYFYVDFISMYSALFLMLIYVNLIIFPSFLYFMYVS